TDIVVVELHQQVARLLSHPAAVGVGRDPGEVDAACRELDEEEDVEALAEERVEGEEVALEDARCLRAEELCPGLLEPSGRRLAPRLLEDLPDGAGGECDPEPDQLALNPPVPPAWVFARELQHELATLACCRRPTGPSVRVGPAARDELA